METLFSKPAKAKARFLGAFAALKEHTEDDGMVFYTDTLSDFLTIDQVKQHLKENKTNDITQLVRDILKDKAMLFLSVLFPQEWEEDAEFIQKFSEIQRMNTLKVYETTRNNEKVLYMFQVNEEMVIEKYCQMAEIMKDYVVYVGAGVGESMADIEIDLFQDTKGLVYVDNGSIKYAEYSGFGGLLPGKATILAYDFDKIIGYDILTFTLRKISHEYFLMHPVGNYIELVRDKIEALKTHLHEKGYTYNEKNIYRLSVFAINMLLYADRMPLYKLGEKGIKQFNERIERIIKFLQKSD